eukprot:CAMPEP_0194358170 /NCGR_PEP_ID=MMETSP0174-20130528/5476_1 /TAXON_ID=216777 /ORGANISM="Proboscia alata, Strain PI-D3" /LENGTH=513 /DNA_ID=CAMNT_0039128417 /DNA_START=70 /DNA_END=1611 /DNA_ORIENTATION=+
MGARTKHVSKLHNQQRDREQKCRTRDILVQRITTKRAEWSDKIASKSIISKHVEDFLSTESNIIRTKKLNQIDPIAKQISNEIDKCIDHKACLRRERASEILKASDNTRNARKSNSILAIPSKDVRCTIPEQSKKSQPKLGEMNPWSVIESFKAIEAEDDLKKERAKAIQKREEMATSLHDNMVFKKAAEQMVNLENTKYAEAQNKELAEWKRKQEETSKVESQKSEQLRRDRQQQVHLRMNLRQKEQKEENKSELDQIAKCKEELRKEEEKKRARRQKEKDRVANIKVENAERAKRREEKRREEGELDVKLMAEMRKRLDDAELQKVQKFNERKDRYEALSAQMQNFGASNKVKEELLHFERKVLREANEKEKANIDRESREQRALGKKKAAIMETNKQMTDEKHRREKTIKQAEKSDAIECCRRMADENLAAVQDALRKKKENSKKYSISLKGQLDQQKLRNALEDMTAIEKSMNREVFQQINNDPLMQEKIIQRVTKSCIVQSDQNNVHA